MITGRVLIDETHRSKVTRRGFGKAVAFVFTLLDVMQRRVSIAYFSSCAYQQLIIALQLIIIYVANNRELIALAFTYISPFVNKNRSLNRK